MLTHTLALEKAVGSEMAEELHKVLVFIPFDRTQIDSLQNPRSLDTLKVIFLHHPCLHEYPLHLHGSERGISYQVHVFLFIKQERIIMLFGKQVVVLPVTFLDIRLFISVVVGQRKFHTLTLQHIIGAKL